MAVEKFYLAAQNFTQFAQVTQHGNGTQINATELADSCDLIVVDKPNPVQYLLSNFSEVFCNQTEDGESSYAVLRMLQEIGSHISEHANNTVGDAFESIYDCVSQYCGDSSMSPSGFDTMDADSSGVNQAIVVVTAFFILCVGCFCLHQAKDCVSRLRESQYTAQDEVPLTSAPKQ